MVKNEDTFKLNSSNGQLYAIKVWNVNECRPPEQRYVTEVYNCTEGGLVDDEYFCGDSFLDLCEPISKKEYNKLVGDIA